MTSTDVVMSPDEQSQAFCEDLDALVNRYIDEFDLAYIDIIGALELKKFEICEIVREEAIVNSEIDDDDDGGDLVLTR